MLRTLRTGFAVVAVASALLVPATSALAAGPDEEQPVIVPASTENLDVSVAAAYQVAEPTDHSEPGATGAEANG
ncbi:MAG TPA: hypothetical protein VFC93_03475 [Chloroflexota bacterium]|nr:hypothetical protein [Chloroflexota bacterium]